MNIIRYDLLTKNIEYGIKNTRISCFLPSHLQNLLVDMKDDDYILGVQYSEKNDIQIGITGTSNIKENWKRTLTRELGEELKLYPKFDLIESAKEYEENKRNWFCCKLNINNTEISRRQDFRKEFDVRNWKRKIGIFVYGEYEKLLNLLTNNYTEYIENDNITHIVIINIGFIKTHIEKFKDWFKPRLIKNKDYFEI